MSDSEIISAVSNSFTYQCLDSQKEPSLEPGLPRLEDNASGDDSDLESEAINKQLFSDVLHHQSESTSNKRKTRGGRDKMAVGSQLAASGLTDGPATSSESNSGTEGAQLLSGSLGAAKAAKGKFGMNSFGYRKKRKFVQQQATAVNEEEPASFPETDQPPPSVLPRPNHVFERMRPLQKSALSLLQEPAYDIPADSGPKQPKNGAKIKLSTSSRMARAKANPGEGVEDSQDQHGLLDDIQPSRPRNTRTRSRLITPAPSTSRATRSSKPQLLIPTDYHRMPGTTRKHASPLSTDERPAGLNTKKHVQPENTSTTPFKSSASSPVSRRTRKRVFEQSILPGAETLPADDEEINSNTEREASVGRSDGNISIRGGSGFESSGSRPNDDQLDPPESLMGNAAEDAADGYESANHDGNPNSTNSQSLELSRQSSPNPGENGARTQIMAENINLRNAEVRRYAELELSRELHDRDIVDDADILKRPDHLSKTTAENEAILGDGQSAPSTSQSRQETHPNPGSDPILDSNSTPVEASELEAEALGARLDFNQALLKIHTNRKYDKFTIGDNVKSLANLMKNIKLAYESLIVEDYDSNDLDGKHVIDQKIEIAIKELIREVNVIQETDLSRRIIGGLNQKPQFKKKQSVIKQLYIHFFPELLETIKAAIESREENGYLDDAAISEILQLLRLAIRLATECHLTRINGTQRNPHPVVRPVLRMAASLKLVEQKFTQERTRRRDAALRRKLEDLREMERLRKGQKDEHMKINKVVEAKARAEHDERLAEDKRQEIIDRNNSAAEIRQRRAEILERQNTAQALENSRRRIESNQLVRERLRTLPEASNHSTSLTQRGRPDVGPTHRSRVNSRDVSRPVSDSRHDNGDVLKDLYDSDGAYIKIDSPERNRRIRRNRQALRRKAAAADKWTEKEQLSLIIGLMKYNERDRYSKIIRKYGQEGGPLSSKTQDDMIRMAAELKRTAEANPTSGAASAWVHKIGEVGYLRDPHPRDLNTDEDFY